MHFACTRAYAWLTPVTITIRNVPDATRDVLARRAEAAGQSMQEYLRARLIEDAGKRTRAEVFESIERRLREHGPYVLDDPRPVWRILDEDDDERVRRISDHLDGKDRDA